jgi:predicted acylesterase/phospholipase RssA
VLFRNYPRPPDANEGNESEDATILQAARATSAAPFYFPAAKVGEVKYFDGGLENNNPIDKVWVERAPIRPSCVVSLGTGISTAPQTHQSVPGFMRSSAKILSNLTNVQDRHRNFKRNMAREGIGYYRFDPDLEKRVGLDDHEKIEKLERETEKYLGMRDGVVAVADAERTREVREQLIACVQKLVKVSDGPVCPY